MSGDFVLVLMTKKSARMSEDWVRVAVALVTWLDIVHGEPSAF